MLNYPPSPTIIEYKKPYSHAKKQKQWPGKLREEIEGGKETEREREGQRKRQTETRRKRKREMIRSYMF